MISDPLAVFLILALVVYLSVRLEERVRAVKALGSVLFAILLAAVLSNVGLLPGTSPTYDLLSGFGVNLGIALILLGIDVRTIRRAGPRMLAAFGIGGVGTAFGAIAAALVVHRYIGEETWKLAGQYTGTYIGGSVNMVAVGRSLDTSPDLFSAAIAADNVTTMIWVAACLALPMTLRRFWPATSTSESREVIEERAPAAGHAFLDTGRAMLLRDAAFLVALSVGTIWVSEAVGSLIPEIPRVLWLTTVALLLAQVPMIRTLAGGAMWGNYAMHLFLAAIGAQSIVADVLRVGPVVFYFTILIILVHGMFIFGLGRALRLELPTLAVASQANVGGPASAMALATARGYSDCLLSGVAVGLLGYAAGNYAGLAVAGLMRSWLGG